MNREQFFLLIRNPLFNIGALIISVVLIISFLGSIIRPDSSPFANTQNLELSNLKPMSKQTFIRIERNEILDESNPLSAYFIGSRSSYNEIPVDTVAVLASGQVMYRRLGSHNIKNVTLADVFYPIGLNEADNSISLINGEEFIYDVVDLEKRFSKERIIERRFILGTDKYGRDLLSRLMSGAYISLSVGFISVIISLIVGMSLGLMAGYFRGIVDKVIMWVINVVWSIPTLLLVIAITLVLGKGFWQIFVAVGLTMWVEVARVVRGQVMSVREKEYVEAGVVLGYSNARIILRHILPNILSPVIVISAANFATAILLEAGLSFLGIGAPPPQATWGKMISEHKAYIITGDAHLAIIPGIAIMLLVLSFTFIGNGLRDALDERQVKRA
jgi:peptide/nickel transport system permease protein